MIAADSYQAQRAICVARNTRHGLSLRGRRNKYYIVWMSMKNRCYNPKSKDFADYGAKGITVCLQWKNDAAAFVAWCESQPKPQFRSLLDRRDGRAGYSPENCRFISDSDSVRNRSMSVWVEINGEHLVLKDAVSKYGVVSYSCAKVRVRERGWKPLDAVIVPSHSVVGRMP